MLTVCSHWDENILIITDEESMEMEWPFRTRLKFKPHLVLMNPRKMHGRGANGSGTLPLC